MAKKLAKSNSNLVTALLYVIVGAVLCIFGGETLGWAFTIGGILFLIFGILEIVKKNLVNGIVSLVIGLVILIGGWKFIDIALIILGVLIAVKGVISLINAFKRRKISAIDVLFAVLTVVAGIMVAFGNGADIIIRIGGIVLAVNGIIALVGTATRK
jgi:uncharacterized membrane protein HdeD (DUF308 family)